MSARALCVVLVWVVVACWLTVVTQGQTVIIGRRVEDISDPRNNPQECGHKDNVIHSLLCDPDQILLHEAQQTVNTALMALTQDTEVMVVIISHMDEALTADNDVHEAAEAMAIALHDRFQSPGVLVFLSIADRAIYFSTSESLQSIVSSEDIAQTITAMRPFLQQADYAAALQSCVNSLRNRIRGVDAVTQRPSSATTSITEETTTSDHEPTRNNSSPTSNSTTTSTTATATLDKAVLPPDEPPSDGDDSGDDHSTDGGGGGGGGGGQDDNKDDEDLFFFGGDGDEPTVMMDAGDTPTPMVEKASMVDDSSMKDLVRGGLLGTAVYFGLRTVTSWARHRRPVARRPPVATAAAAMAAKRSSVTAVAALVDRPPSTSAVGISWRTAETAVVKPSIGTSEASTVRAVVAQQAKTKSSRSSRLPLSLSSSSSSLSSSHRHPSSIATDEDRSTTTDMDTLLSPLPLRATAAAASTVTNQQGSSSPATTSTTTPRSLHPQGGYWTLARRILHYVTPEPGSPTSTTATTTTTTATTTTAGTSKRSHFSSSYDDDIDADRWMMPPHRRGTTTLPPSSSRRRRVDGDRW